MAQRDRCHPVGDINRGSDRSNGEVDEGKRERGPIVDFGRHLTEQGVAGEDALAAVGKGMEPAATKAIARARGFLSRRMGRGRPRLRRLTGARTSDIQAITVSQAIDETIAEEMRRDERVFALGEAFAEAGDLFEILAGPSGEFGTERLLDTPISEPGSMGVEVGAAMTGMRPVVALMFGDFLFLVVDQVCNRTADTHYMAGSEPSVPPVRRTSMGAGRRRSIPGRSTRSPPTSPG